MSTAMERPWKRQKAVSASASSAQAVLQNPSSKPVLQQPPVILIVMYYPGIKDTQFKSNAIYTKLITGELKADVTAAILEHEADIIMLCELERVADGIAEEFDRWPNEND